MAQPTLGSLTLNAVSISPSRRKSLVKHVIPTRDGDRLQNMGFSSRSWSISADLIGLSKDTEKSTLEGYYNNDTAVSFVFQGTTYTVRIEDLIIVEDVSSTMYEITMSLVEDG